MDSTWYSVMGLPDGRIKVWSESEQKDSVASEGACVITQGRCFQNERGEWLPLDQYSAKVVAYSAKSMEHAENAYREYCEANAEALKRIWPKPVELWRV